MRGPPRCSMRCERKARSSRSTISARTTTISTCCHVFPFDYVKIDRQFVSQLNGGSAGLIEGIASVAHHYDLKIIAEGVETEAQHRALHTVGIQYAQGYLYQRPQRVEHLKQEFAWAPV